MDSATSDGSGGSGGSSGGGDSAKIEGSMGQPDGFPEDAAAELRYAASWLDEVIWIVVEGKTRGEPALAAVKGVIQTIKDLLGDHTIARDLAITWGTSTTIADVKRDLTSAKGELDSYWKNSGAKEGFDTYFGSATDALDTAGDKFEKMSDTLVNSIQYIYKTYGDAINFLTDAAAAAVLLWPPDTVSAISTLIDKVGDLASETYATTGDFAADATTIQAVPAQFDAPAELSGAVDDSDSWHVQPA